MQTLFKHLQESAKNKAAVMSLTDNRATYVSDSLLTCATARSNFCSFGRQFKSIHTETTQFRDSFFPSAFRLTVELI